MLECNVRYFRTALKLNMRNIKFTKVKSKNLNIIRININIEELSQTSKNTVKE